MQTKRVLIERPGREYESWCLLIIHGENKYKDFINVVFFSERSFAFSACPCADLGMMTYL
jgi:hypothetical protein